MEGEWISGWKERRYLDGRGVDTQMEREWISRWKGSRHLDLRGVYIQMESWKGSGYLFGRGVDIKRNELYSRTLKVNNSQIKFIQIELYTSLKESQF